MTEAWFWPQPGDLVVYRVGGTNGVPLRVETALWLGNDYHGKSILYLYLSQDGTLCRTFNSQGFIVMSRLSDMEQKDEHRA